MYQKKQSFSKRRRLLVLGGILFVALNLRPAIVSVSPLLETIRADLNISYTAVSLLTTIPVLCMGLFALAVPIITRYVGHSSAVFYGVCIIGISTLMRFQSDSVVILFGSTILVGIGIAIAQTLLPSMVNTYYPNRPVGITGLYSVSLTAGATIAAIATVPLATGLESWTNALAIWGILVFLALPVWVPIVRGEQPQYSISSSADPGYPISSLLAWILVIFFGITSTLFYSGVTWIPSRYISLGWSEDSASLLLTIFLLTQFIGMFAVTVFADRSPDRRPWLIIMSIMIAVGCFGIAIMPVSFPWVWSTIFGIGAGGLFTLALALPIDLSTENTSIDELSSMVFAGGYSISAAGPSLIGVIRDLGGSYSMVFLGMCLLAILLSVTALTIHPNSKV